MADATTVTPDFLRDYESPASAEALADSPRFGHTRDFSALFHSEDEAQDYAIGLLYASIITFFCFIFFIIIILVLKCMGSNRVGFLSGKPFKYTYDPTNDVFVNAITNKPESVTDGDHLDEDDDDNDENDNEHNNDNNESTSNNKKNKRCNKRCSNMKKRCNDIPTQNWVRITFIISGSIFILCAILLVTEGMTNLQSTVNTVNRSSGDIKDIAREANAIMNTGIKDIKGIAESVRQSLKEELETNEFCPSDPELDGHENAGQIRVKAHDAMVMLKQLNDFISNDIEEIATAIDSAKNTAEEIERETSSINITDWEAILILLFYTMIPCLLISGAILAHYNVEYDNFIKCINYILLPLFIIMVIISILIATIMVSSASANADFCLPDNYQHDTYVDGTPDTSILRILDYTQGYSTNNGQQEVNFVRKVTEYYVKQCQDVTNPFDFLQENIPDLTESQQALTNLMENIEAEGIILELSLYCNREFDQFEALVSEMKTILDVMLEAIDRTMDIVACERIVPIYHHMVYDGACQYSITAIFWIFSTNVIMASMGLLMILFRAAYKPTIYEVQQGIVDIKEDPLAESLSDHDQLAFSHSNNSEISESDRSPTRRVRVVEPEEANTKRPYYEEDNSNSHNNHDHEDFSHSSYSGGDNLVTIPIEDTTNHRDDSQSSGGAYNLVTVPIDEVDPNEEWISKRGQNALEY